jgi:hypothetical protein
MLPSGASVCRFGTMMRTRTPRSLAAMSVSIVKASGTDIDRFAGRSDRQQHHEVHALGAAFGELENICASNVQTTEFVPTHARSSLHRMGTGSGTESGGRRSLRRASLRSAFGLANL